MKSVIFFDIDGVLVKEQTQKLFVKFLLSQRKMSLWRAGLIFLWFFLYKIGFCKDVIKIRKFAFKVFQGWDIATMSQIINRFYTKILCLNLNHKLIDRLKEHQSRGDVVVFLSATIKEIAVCLAEILDVNWVLATELEILDGKYTGQIRGVVPYGSNKPEFIKEFISKHSLSLEKSCAYADHFSDLAVLKLVRSAIVVNPVSELERIAKNQGWEILVN